ncbi:MAG: glycosyltransferase family 2 protein [Nitrososphaerota archaeon]|nr:glycosyltransferase family 2 protein [Nitrososphaerota archaeon]
MRSKPNRAATQFEDAIANHQAASLDISIIIPTYNRSKLVCELVRFCAALISTELTYETAEIIVVDDGSIDTTYQDLLKLRNEYPDLLRVLCQNNSGVAVARNHGARESLGRVLIYIDSDCLPRPGWLKGLYLAAEDGGVAYAQIVGARLPYYPLEVSPYGARFPGASFAISRNDYLRLGGMCQEFGHHLEDSDFHLKCVRVGLFVSSVQTAKVFHPLRERSLREVWMSGRLHSFDALLLKRHGEHSYDYLRNALAIFNIGPYYGISLMAASLSLIGSATFVFTGSGSVISQAISIGEIYTFAYLVWLGLCAMFFGVPALCWPKYYVASAIYIFGSFIGRAEGSLKFKTFVI